MFANLLEIGAEQRRNRGALRQGWQFTVVKMPSTSRADACYGGITGIPYSRTKP